MGGTEAEARRFASEAQETPCKGVRQCISVTALPNVGREAHAYLQFIVRSYEHGLHDVTVFTQAAMGSVNKGVLELSPSGGCIGFVSFGWIHCIMNFGTGWEYMMADEVTGKKFEACAAGDRAREALFSLWAFQSRAYRFAMGNLDPQLPPWIGSMRSHFAVLAERIRWQPRGSYAQLLE